MSEGGSRAFHANADQVFIVKGFANFELIDPCKISWRGKNVRRGSRHEAMFQDLITSQKKQRTIRGGAHDPKNMPELRFGNDQGVNPGRSQVFL